MSALSDLMANVIEPGGIMPGRNYRYFMTPEGDVTAPGQKAMPTSTGVQTSPPATGNLPPGVAPPCRDGTAPPERALAKATRLSSAAVAGAGTS